MNAFEKILNTFSYGGLFLTACALVVLILVLFRFIRSKRTLYFDPDILPEENTEHRKKRKAFIIWLVVFALIANLTLSAFIVKEASSSFSYLFFPVHSATFSKNTLTVSELTEYKTEAPNEYRIEEYSGNVSGGKEESFSFTADTSGSFLFSVKKLSDGLVLKICLRDSGGNEIDCESGVRSYTIASMDNVQKGRRYTIIVTAEEGEGAFTIESIAPKNFDIKHFTAIKDRVDYKYQSNVYYFTAYCDGYYAFYLTDVLYSCDVGITVPEAEETLYSTDESVTVALKKGETYAVIVNQIKSFGSYTLNVCRQKSDYDISDVTTVNDVIEFPHQLNIYTITGRSEFLVKFKINDLKASVSLLDEGGNVVASQEDIGGDSRFSAIDLDPNKTYTLVVVGVHNNGKYEFTLE